MGVNQQEKASKTKYYRECGILDTWHDKTFDDFVNDEDSKKVVIKYLSEAKQWYKKGVGLYLYGDNGVGKSLLLNCAFKELIKQEYRVRIISMPTLITLFTAGWSDSSERKNLVRVLQSADFLGIEELGKGTKTDLGNLVLESVIRYRNQMKKPIFITTNSAPSTITTTYSKDVASMLNECCVELHVEGKDYRKQIHSENFKHLSK